MGLNNCMSPRRGPCANFQLGLRISANSVANFNTATSLHYCTKQFASRRKMVPRGQELSRLYIYICTLIGERIYNCLKRFILP